MKEAEPQRLRSRFKIETDKNNRKRGSIGLNMKISPLSSYFITLFLIQIHCGTLPQVGVITDPSVVQQEQVTMKVYTQLITSIPSDGGVNITLPSEMAFSTNIINCQLNIPSTVKATCIQTDTNKVTATFSASIPSGSFELQINKAIKNPQSTTPTSSFRFITYSGAGLILDQLQTGISLISTVGDFVSTALASDDQRVGQTTNLVVRFTANHRIPFNGQIKMSFPKWNPESQTDQLEYLQGAISCTSTNTAVLQTNLQCSFSNSILTVTNLAIKDIPGGTEVAFRIAGFRNPLSTALISGFAFQTLDQSGGLIDVSSVGATLKISQPAVIGTSAFGVDPTVDQSIAGYVGETNIMQVSFLSPVPLNQGCKIIVTLPSQFNLDSITKVTISGLLGVQRQISITKSGLSFNFQSCDSYTSNQLQGIIRIDSLTLPGYAKATSSLNVEIKDKNDNYIAATQNGPTFTPIAGTGLNVAFTQASPDVILSSADLTIEVRPSRTLGLVGQFVLQFSDRYTLNSGVCSTFQSMNGFVSGSPTCSFSSTQLTLTNFITQTIPKGSGTLLQFKVGKITLPSTLADRTFLGWIRQQDSSDKQFYDVEKFNGVITLKMNYGKISATVTPATFTAYENTQYTFAITPDHRMELNGYIQIQYPKDVSIPDPSFSQSQCKNFQGFPTTPTCVIDPKTRTITVNNGFRIVSSQSSSQLQTYTFSIPGFLNPLTLDTTDTFKMQTKTQDGSLMDILESGLTLKMTRVPYIKSVIATPASLVNSAITSYTFLFTPTVPINSGYSVILVFPNDITIPTDSNLYKCTSEDTSIIQTVSCSTYNPIGNSVRAQLTLRAPVTGINPLQTFRITVNGIKNPLSTKQTSTFDFIITDTQLSSLSTLNKVSQPVTIMTNTPYTLQKATFKANTTGAGQNAAYTIQIYPENKVSSGGGLVIVYPSQIGVPGTITATVTSIATLQDPKVTVEKSSRRITITNVFQADYNPEPIGVTITLAGFVNPMYNTEKTNSFIVRTMNTVSGVNYFIDQVIDGLILNAPCDYPCSTCAPDKPSVCQSCYQTSDLNKLQGDTCVSTCSTGKFYNSTAYTCDNCDPSCLSCIDRATKCTQCGVGNLLYLYENTCRSDCPEGYVKDSTKNRCNKCVNNCKTCEFTETTCTSCQTNSAFAYFYQKSCLQSCPSDTSVALPGYQCGDCDTSCKTCKGIATNCTSCLSHMRYDSVRGTCTTMCQEGYQIFDEKQSLCLYCDPTCNTCAGNTTTCTTCKSGKVLTTENTCASKCTADDQIPLAGVCKQCELPCAQCKGTTNKCTKCQGDYLLYNNTCVQYCPEKFKVDNTSVNKQCIYEGLICPSGFHVNDAGDGCIPNEFECPPGYMINQQKTACVPAPGSIVPFPFLFLSACLAILVLGSYIKDKFFTKVYTCLITLIGKQELLIYGLMVCYSGANEKWIPFILSGIALIMLITANIIFYLIYKRDICKDPSFAKWCRMFPKTEKNVSMLALMLNFKSIKLLYSGFYGLESCLAQFEDPMRNFFRPLKMITYFSFVFVYIPIIAADVIIFMQVQWGYQLLILAIESLILAILIFGLTIAEFRHPERLLMSGDEQYIRIKPRGFGDINVMGAMVDVDESTLIRSKIVDDDYEIQLRKRALVQILGQVGKNFMDAQEKGVHLGQDLDKCMTKFDEEQIKLRRAFSLEEIREEESWIASDHSDNVKQCNFLDDSQEQQQEFLDDDMYDLHKPRRFSFPLSPRSRAMAPDPNFKAQIQEIKHATMEFLQDNVYAECRPTDDNNRDQRRKKTVSRRTQTYLRELLMMEGEGLQDSDMEVVLDEEAEIEKSYAQNLIDGVIDHLSEAESQNEGLKKKKTKKKKKAQKDAVPDFELADIMGEFEIDDLGNFIILRGERGELLDKGEKRVNRRGYLIDRFGNVINKNGQIIFKAIELDSDDEIPAPFGFEKRKKNLLSIDDEQFKVQETEKQVNDDEDLIDKELKAMRKSGKKKRKMLESAQDGSHIPEEDGDDESSVDSLMAESPAKYAKVGQDPLPGQATGAPIDTKRSAKSGISKKESVVASGINEQELLNRVTQIKVPKKRPPPGPAIKQPQEQANKSGKMPVVKSKLSPKTNSSAGGVLPARGQVKQSIDAKSGSGIQEAGGARSLSGHSMPGGTRPHRIKRDDTKELFPSLAIESIEQKKLFKIAESIGGMANQIAEHQRRQMHSQEGRPGRVLASNSLNVIDPEQLDRMKQEHFKDIINESQLAKNQHLRTLNQHYMSETRFSQHAPPQANLSLEKIYGNLGDVIAYEERIIEQQHQLRARPISPESQSQMTQKRGKRQHENPRMTGLEAIYLQKFDKKAGQTGGFRKGNQERAKFRTTLHQFVDDPELLVEDGIDHQRQNEMSSLVAEKLDRLQRQYVTSTSSNRLLSNIPITSMGFANPPGGGSLTAVHASGASHNMAAMGRKTGSATGLTLDIAELDPVLKGNWMQQTSSQVQQSLQ